MSLVFTVLGALLLVALIWIIGFVMVLLMHWVAVWRGWYTKELKISWLDRKLSDIMNK
jgi:hypothetical protein